MTSSQPVPDSRDHDSWKVYLLECADGTYYCGVAKHLDNRLAEHNGLRRGGAKYTRGRRPVTLLAARVCPDKQSAYRLEHAVKAAARDKKLQVLLVREVLGLDVAKTLPVTGDAGSGQ